MIRYASIREVAFNKLKTGEKISVMKKIYVGNISFAIDESELTNWFQTNSGVKAMQVELIRDRETQKSKGFAFVTVQEFEIDRAILALNGKELGGRKATVNEARPREDRFERTPHAHGRRR